MPPYIDVLLSRAYKVIPGMDYNRYRMEASCGLWQDIVFYEVSLLQERPWEYLRDQVYPAFARYVKAKSKDPEAPEGVTVAIFRGDRCFLLRGEDFIKAFLEIEGLNRAAFHFRVLNWLST